MADKIQKLTCGNSNCANPNWERPSVKGKLPKYCPNCKPLMAQKLETDKETAGQQRAEQELSERPEFDPTQFDNDEDLFMHFVAGPIDNRKLMAWLEWDEDTYIDVKESLVQQNRITKIRGGYGGALRPFADGDKLHVAEPTLDISQFDCDEDALLSLVPQEGTIGNVRARTILEWDEERYFQTRDNLVKENKVVRCKGSGGALRRFEKDDIVYQEEEEKETKQVDETTGYTINRDPVVHTCLGEETAQRIIDALKAKYGKQDFYTEPEGDELNVKLRLKCKTIKVTPDVFERVQAVAFEASLPPPPPVVTEEPVSEE